MPNAVLRKLETHVRLSDEDRQLVEAHTRRIQHLEPREDLIKEGTDPQSVNIILDGWACRYKQLVDGRRQILSVFVPGDMCDPMVFLLRGMSHALGTLTAATVVRVAREDVEDMMSRSPTLARAFWLDMLVSAEIQREWTMNLGRRTATERMAHLFCELPVRLGNVGLSDGTECELPMTQADLADALGLSTVHVNRTLQDLRAAGLVELKGRRLKIHDEEGLRDLAMFDPSYLHLRETADR